MIESSKSVKETRVNEVISRQSNIQCNFATVAKNGNKRTWVLCHAKCRSGGRVLWDKRTHWKLTEAWSEFQLLLGWANSTMSALLVFEHRHRFETEWVLTTGARVECDFVPCLLLMMTMKALGCRAGKMCNSEVFATYWGKNFTVYRRGSESHHIVVMPGIVDGKLYHSSCLSIKVVHPQLELNSIERANPQRSVPRQRHIMRANF